MQSYTEIAESATIEASRALLLGNDKTIMSCSSGTAFPTTNLQVGMLCLRTDQWKLYQLKDASAPVWVLIADLTKTYLSKEAADALYAALSHNHDGGAITTGTVAMARLPAVIQQLGAATGGFASANLSGSTGGYAGINFSDASRYLLVSGTGQGFWTGAAWLWRFDNGALTVGTVPVSQITGLGSAATVNTGTGVGQIPTVQADGKLPPAVLPVIKNDGSNIFLLTHGF